MERSEVNLLRILIFLKVDGLWLYQRDILVMFHQNVYRQTPLLWRYIVIDVEVSAFSECILFSSISLSTVLQCILDIWNPINVNFGVLLYYAQVSLQLHKIVEELYFHCSLFVCVYVCESVCLYVCLSNLASNRKTSIRRNKVNDIENIM